MGNDQKALFVPKMSAVEVLRVLKARYGRAQRSVFLAEVKDGPTWAAGYGSLGRYDAVTIKRSWSDPCITGYEIKVSRADFLGDEKWPKYLESCHRLYFVCPKGLITPDEVDAKAGLITVNEQGGVSVRKKAPFRSIELPAAMLYHLVISHMAETKVPGQSRRREYLQDYLKDKHIDYSFGRVVGTKMARELQEAKETAEKAERTLKKIQDRLDGYEELKELLDGYGVHWYRTAHAVSELRKLLETAKAAELVEKLEEVAEAFKTVGVTDG